jgi:hypothetical protein
MVDRYTKAVLTVIAISLLGLLAQNVIGPLNAQARVQRVAICSAVDPENCASLGYFQIPGTSLRELALTVLVQERPK